MIKQLSGLTVTGVFWIHSTEKNYARFFLTTGDGSCFEVKMDGLETSVLPGNVDGSLEEEFREILGKSKIKDVRTDDQTDLAILLDSGHIMLMGGTFDGDDPGNSFFLETPAEVSEWQAEFSKLRQVNAAKS